MNPYKILGCSNNENKEQINKKYKKLALKYHPDRNKSLDKTKQEEYENKFKEITSAYDILKKNNFKYSSQTDDKSNPNKQSNTNMNMNNFFTEVLRRQQQKKKVDFFYHITNDNIQKLNSISLNVKSTLKDVYNNKVFYIGITHDMNCKYCFGSGYRIDIQSNCPKCNGKKRIKQQFDIKVESKYKQKKFKYSGNNDLGKKLSNILIDIKIIDHKQFKIINEYNIFFNVKLTKDIITIVNDLPTINIKFNYLDNTKKTLTINKPKKSLSEEYNFKNLGLLKPNNERGELLINIIDSDMLLFKYK
jgi:DnaJ-class molecular chaperone